MSALPFHYAPARVVNGRVRTCRLVEIGSAYVPRTNYARSTDEAALQAALLMPAPRPSLGHRVVLPVCLVAALVLVLLMLSGAV